MYSRNYGRGDISAKITPPPSYSGSAIQGGDRGGIQPKEEPKTQTGAFAPFSQNIPLPKSEEEEKDEKNEENEESATAAPPPADPHKKKVCEEVKKEKSSFLSSFLPDLSAEDLILIGIVIALAFDLADRDILLVALVAAVVIM